MGFRDGDNGVSGCSGISWTICKQSAPRSRQITTATPHHQYFTGRMLFLTHDHSTEGTVSAVKWRRNRRRRREATDGDECVVVLQFTRDGRRHFTKLLLYQLAVFQVKLRLHNAKPRSRNLPLTDEGSTLHPTQNRSFQRRSS